MNKYEVTQEITATRRISVDIPDAHVRPESADLAVAYVKAALAAGQKLPWVINEATIKPLSAPISDDIPF